MQPAAGGGFSYLGSAADEAGSAKVKRAFGVLRGWHALKGGLPPSAALETILQETGLLNYLAAAEMGGSRAGNVFKLLEVLRGREGEEMPSFSSAVEFIGEWAGAQPVEEMSLAPGRRDAVRLMNLHKAKVPFETARHALIERLVAACPADTFGRWARP